MRKKFLGKVKIENVDAEYQKRRDAIVRKIITLLDTLEKH